MLQYTLARQNISDPFLPIRLTGILRGPAPSFRCFYTVILSRITALIMASIWRGAQGPGRELATRQPSQLLPAHAAGLVKGVQQKLREEVYARATEQTAPAPKIGNVHIQLAF